MNSEKPQMQPRSSLTRKPESEDGEVEAKPTLEKRASKMSSRQERISEGLNKLDDTRLQALTTKIGPDELAVALLDADPALKSRVAACLPPDKLKVFNEYLGMGRDKLPGDVIDGVQGKLLRLTI